ncbi:hypothetical protein D9756_010162 [Leucocoprinus leucothites]|uniref:Nephrocystin 3-like N-terminal domain-containing protein n=1 Tax=Leucocoprinus leucothites TaxID=201217 RepID=A0A8H5FT05_9AGAR|nr:hypothetical protein D9756_010162 [Leucoagaricus leucothites]
MEGKPPWMEPVTSASSSSNQNTLILDGASDFIINNPIMVTNHGSNTEIKKLLEKKAMVDGTYDSAARHYTAPQCHSDTRVPLRERLIDWLLNINRVQSLFWLYGPAGVGKSAIVQYIMEYCAQQGLPGAGLFLSRANKRNDPNRIIPSLAHQLALAYPAYRQLVSNVLITDPTILEKRLPLQFRQLIDEPADALRIGASRSVASHPIPLVLDGLDECNSYEAQRELIKIFVSFGSTCKARQLPFVCLVTSRPEWQIVSTFDALGPASGVWREELRMDTSESRRDVSKVLRDGFEQIKSKHSDAFSADIEWPTGTDLRKIESAASGNMLLASLVVACVDDDDPTAQLELCLKSLQGKLTSDERNPFEPLTALYRGLLLSIPRTLLRTALLVLYFHISCSNRGLGFRGYGMYAKTMVNLLFVEQKAFYGSLRRLRSVLSVPSPATAWQQPLVFSHTTFADYVKVAVQAGHFGLHEVDALTEIRAACIKWHQILGKRPKDIRKDLLDIAPWAKGIADDSYHFRGLIRSVLFQEWHDMLQRGDVEKLQEELENFAFSDLPRRFVDDEDYEDYDDYQYFYDEERDDNNFRDIHQALKGLARGLVTKEHTFLNIQSSTSTCIVRTVPLWPTDYQLINRYVAVFGQWTTEMKPLDWDATSPSMWNYTGLYFCSLKDSFDDCHAFEIIWRITWCPTLSYFLLGHSDNTVLVIVYPSVASTDGGMHWKESLMKMKTPHSSDESLLDLIKNSPYDSEYSEGTGGLVMNIVSFIADPWCPSPHSRLKIIADILYSTTNSGEIFHLIFHHTLNDIPHNLSHIAHQILAFLIIHTRQSGYYRRVHLKVLKHFLCLDDAIINCVLQWLRPLVFSWYPNSSDPGTGYLILKVPPCSIRLPINHNCCGRGSGVAPWLCVEEQAWVVVFGLWIAWSSCYLTTGDDSWVSSLFGKIDFLGKTWEALHDICTSDGLATAAAYLCDFPFCRLDRGLFAEFEFRKRFEDLVFRLSSDSGFSPLLRTQPNCPMDCLLLEKWAQFGRNSEFATLPIERERHTEFYPISLSTTKIPPLTKAGYRIFLIGYGENTCLIAMTPYEYKSSYNDEDEGDTPADSRIEPAET